MGPPMCIAPLLPPMCIAPLLPPMCIAPLLPPCNKEINSYFYSFTGLTVEHWVLFT